jgi:hypothetical protein
MTDVGSFQLTSIAKLANVTVAYPGEHWSDGKALPAEGSSSIVPGALVVPTSASGNLLWTPVTELASVDPRACIALRPVSVPDINPGSEYNPQLTPNDIMNLPLAAGQYVHAYRSGSFHLTLIAPDSTYAPGDLVGFDPAATPAAGKPGPGAWVKVTDATEAFFEVRGYRPLTFDNTIGVLTVNSLRVQA